MDQLFVMKNTVLILGHSFIVRLSTFVRSAEHAKINLNLNLSEKVISEDIRAAQSI